MLFQCASYFRKIILRTNRQMMITPVLFGLCVIVRDQLDITREMTF